MKSVAVYTGHQFGNNPKYARDAGKVGTLIAQNGIRLVFGGGDVGLMGAVANGAISAGGEVIGVSTQKVIDLQEPMHEGIHVEIAKNISERRQRMYELSEGFIILPGGMGTLDELTDIMVRQQIKETRKPLFFLNTGRYWDMFGKLFAHMHMAGFIQNPKDYNMTVFESPEELIKAIINR
jgi:uncharacterized protein (TIGR00730 family)